MTTPTLVMGLIFFVFAGAATTSAQTAKYDQAGNLTFITGLLSDTAGCEASVSFTGKITKVDSFPSDAADGWQFVLAIVRSKPVKFEASLSHDEGAVLADFDEMLQTGRRLKVKARRCGSGGYWTVEEIWRL